MTLPTTQTTSFIFSDTHKRDAIKIGVAPYKEGTTFSDSYHPYQNGTIIGETV